MNNSKIKKEEAIFAKKVVSFSTANNTLALKNIKFEIQKERLFVVGKIPKGATTNDWAEGRHGAIAWDSVTDYLVFDSEPQYKELINKSEK